MSPLPRRSTVTVRHDSTFRPTGICRGCTADERKHLESVPPVHTTEFRNVIVRNDTLHVYLDAADERSQYWTGQLRGHLSAQALGAKDSAALGRRIAVQVHNQPVWCSQWDDVTAVFIRPRILCSFAECHARTAEARLTVWTVQAAHAPATALRWHDYVARLVGAPGRLAVPRA